MYRRRLEELLEDTLNILRRAGFVVESITYPKNKRSIDIVGTYHGKKAIVKVSIDCSRITRVEIEDLRKASIAYEASPLIVAEAHRRQRIEDDVVYVRKDITVVNNTTLEQYIIHGEKPLVANIQGSLLVRINPLKFRRRRLELGYTMGETATLLSVSRKTIYEYERGSIYVSLDKAIRIAEIFGEDVLEPFDILSERIEGSEKEYMDEPSNRLEEALFRLAMRKGYAFYKLLRTPIDYILAGRKNSLSIIKPEENNRRFRLKIEQAEKISRTMKTKPIVVKEREDIEEVKDYI